MKNLVPLFPFQMWALRWHTKPSNLSDIIRLFGGVCVTWVRHDKVERFASQENGTLWTLDNQGNVIALNFFDEREIAVLLLHEFDAMAYCFKTETDLAMAKLLT